MSAIFKGVISISVADIWPKSHLTELAYCKQTYWWTSWRYGTNGGGIYSSFTDLALHAAYYYWYCHLYILQRRKRFFSCKEHCFEQGNCVNLAVLQKWIWSETFQESRCVSARSPWELINESISGVGKVPGMANRAISGKEFPTVSTASPTMLEALLQKVIFRFLK